MTKGVPMQPVLNTKWKLLYFRGGQLRPQITKGPQLPTHYLFICIYVIFGFSLIIMQYVSVWWDYVFWLCQYIQLLWTHTHTQTHNPINLILNHFSCFKSQVAFILFLLTNVSPYNLLCFWSGGSIFYVYRQ